MECSSGTLSHPEVWGAGGIALTGSRTEPHSSFALPCLPEASSSKQEPAWPPRGTYSALQ